METTKQNEHIGFRVAAARKQADLTQEALSDALGFKDRQILSNIESGKRALSPEELVKIMEVTGLDLNFFTDPYRLVGEGRFSFRAEKADAEMLNDFESQAGRWVALYRRLTTLDGDPRFAVTPYTLSLKLGYENTFEEAAAAAEWLQREWELGPVPSRTLVEAAERELRLLVLFVDAPDGISGAACRLTDLDTVIVNRRDNPGRRHYDFAHELFHILTWDRMPPARMDVANPKAHKAKRAEQMANAFASRLLFPKDELRTRWECRDANTSTEQSLRNLAKSFGTSTQALFWRLVNDGLLEKDAVSDYRSLPEPLWDSVDTPRTFSGDFLRILHKSLDSGAISARKASKVLGVTLEEMAMLFDEHGLSRPYDL
ncbi:MAG: helix-turn-helix domain-containing protein [Verrucomicrobia bacterium]|nr:helix-turn-helix domain-containing protein [Verrucomicrobiota bacterium]MCH8514500.1 XRE family transcriptional regulator [Kiritimatiellia bacterium]